MTRRGTTVLALTLGLLLAALATRRAEVAWMAAPLLTALGWATLRAPAPGAVRLAATRRVDREPDGAVGVTLSVRQEGQAPLHLRLEDQPPGAVPLERGAAAGRWLLRPGEVAELRYALRLPRGRFAWRTLRATASDALGLLEEVVEPEAPCELLELPEAARLQPLPLRPGRTLPVPGAIPARVGGSGTEFFGVREYHVGDALRWLDWRRMARHPGTPFTKEFEQERMADVGVVLDGREVPEPGPGEEAVFEHAVRAAASLAAAALRQGNRTSLLVLGEPEGRVFPGAGRVQLRRILSSLAEARPSRHATLRAFGSTMPRLFPAGAIVLVVSPLTADGRSLLLRLRAGDRRVVVVSPDPIALRAPSVGRDPSSRLALRAARIERRVTLRAVAQLRIPVVDWRVHEPLGPLLCAALRPARGGQRP